MFFEFLLLRKNCKIPGFFDPELFRNVPGFLDSELFQNVTAFLKINPVWHPWYTVLPKCLIFFFFFR